MDELEELRGLYRKRDKLSPDEGREWVGRVSELLHTMAPARAEEFDELTPYLFAGLSEQVVAPTWVRVGSVIRAALAEVERRRSAQGPTAAEDPGNVFVVHGRHERLRASMFAFLRSIGLKPLEWSHAVRSTGKPSPYIGEILDSAFERVQAVVVLLSPDDEVRLSESLWGPEEPFYERTVQMQARPNVLFEAGRAFGTHPERTLLVQVGHVKPFSDVAGRHLLFLDDSTEKRKELAQRLQSAGCPVDLDGEDWMSAGDFSVDLPQVPSFESQRPEEIVASRAPRAELNLRTGYLGRWREEQIIVENLGDAVAEEIRVLADGEPIDQHQVWVSGQTLPTRLRPGEQMGVKIALTMGSPERVEVAVYWQQEDGTEGSVERSLQLF